MRALIIHRELFEGFKHLTDEEAGIVLRRGIMLVEHDHEEHNHDEKGAVAVVWAMVRKQIKANGEKYDAICQQKKDAANARWTAERQARPFKAKQHAQA